MPKGCIKVIPKFKESLKQILPSWLMPLAREIYSFSNRIFYYGNKYECPICKSKLRKFLPIGEDFPVLKEKQVIGAGYRETGMCPVCHANDRERLEYLYLLSQTNIFEKKLKLLHVSPEIGLWRIFKHKKNIQYLSSDYNPTSYLVMQKIDITNIKYSDNYFDVIICNHVLEHIPDDKKAIRELYRVLNQGGWAIIQVPLSPILKNTYEDATITTEKDREKNFGLKDHCRLYGLDYKNRLENNGFHVTLFDISSFLSEKFIDKYGINNREILYVCKK